MNNKLIYIFIILFSSVLNYGQSSKNNYNSFLNESEELAYHFNFDASRVLILKAIDIQPENPKAYHHLSRHYLWYYLGSKNISEYYKFLGYSDSALTRAERLEDINSDDAQNLYLLGNIFKQRSMAYAENHKTMDAFWAARDAVGYYEDVLDVSPTHFSAYGGIGIFEYALSFIPSFIQWALPVTGLSADKNEGFAKLEKAYKNGNDDKVEYMFHIAKLFDEHLADYGKAISILESLVSTYPENSLFHYQLGLEFIKLKNLDKAKIEMEKVIEINHPKFAQTNSFANFLIGDIYFYQNQFDKAIEFYLNFLNSSKTIDYTGIASLRVALCYHFSEEEGNTEAYRRYLKLASNGNLEIEDDVYADEESKLLLKYGVTKQKENLIKLENIYNIGKYDDVISNFTKKRNSFQDVEMRGLALLYLSSSLIEKMKLVEAQKIAEEIISLEVNRNKWIKPMALFNLAKIKYKQKDYYRIEGPLVEAEDANEFGKQNLIQSYINGLRRKVKQK